MDMKLPIFLVATLSQLAFGQNQDRWVVSGLGAASIAHQGTIVARKKAFDNAMANAIQGAPMRVESSTFIRDTYLSSGSKETTDGMHVASVTRSFQNLRIVDVLKSEYHISGDSVSCVAVFAVTDEPQGEEFGLQIRGVENVYTHNSSVKLRVTSERDCYIYGFSLGSDNHMYQIFPNNLDTDNRLVAGEVREIPGADTYELAAFLHDGQDTASEMMIVVASSEEVPFQGGRQHQENPRLLSVRQTDLEPWQKWVMRVKSNSWGLAESFYEIRR